MLRNYFVSIRYLILLQGASCYRSTNSSFEISTVSCINHWWLLLAKKSYIFDHTSDIGCKVFVTASEVSLLPCGGVLGPIGKTVCICAPRLFLPMVTTRWYHCVYGVPKGALVLARWKARRDPTSKRVSNSNQSCCVQLPFEHVSLCSFYFSHQFSFRFFKWRFPNRLKALSRNSEELVVSFYTR